MAIVQNTLIGRAKGSVGNATFSQWKGLNILKQKPSIVANPRSAQQQSNRSRFVALMQMALLLRPVIAIGFKEYANRMSWMNKFMSTNTNSGLFEWVGDAETGNWVRTSQNIVIAEGSLYPTPFGSSFANASTLNLSWFPGVVANQTSTDSFIGIAVAESQIATISRLDGVTRSDAGAQFIFSPLADGEEVLISGFFMSPDGAIVSNSFAMMGTYEAP